MKHSPIEPARLSWQESTPVSDQFDDIYFNKDGGLAETDYVFLQGNNLQSRFSQFNGKHFTIAETGFGTGLNFLAARALWLKHSTAEQSLHFISVEKHPLRQQDLQQALAQVAQLNDGAQQLIDQYPPELAGFHRLIFDGGRVQLTLMLGDADDCFPQLDAQVDAWFLDGFAPAKNPGMWTETLFRSIAQRSSPNTTFATFTAAGVVRRGLKEVGFEVQKIPGFGRKREMLIGQFQPTAEQTFPPISAPWFQRPQPLARDASITIIGAGLAGLCTAWALAQRGRKVRVLERSAQVASGGSGNRQGALYAKPTLESTKQSRLHLSGMLFSQRWLSLIDPDQTLWDNCGVMLTAQNDKVARRFQQIINTGHIPASMLKHLDAEEASEEAGLPVHSPALLFSDTGWVNPAALCRKLSAHPSVELHYNWPVEQLEFNEADQNWTLIGNNQVMTSDIVIIAGAADCLQFSQSSALPLKPIRGQVTHADVPLSLPELKTVICADGYISPPLDGQYCFGATFDLRDCEPRMRETDTQRNLDTLAVALPELSAALKQQTLTQGRVGWRCASSDYLPLVGALPDQPAFIEQYAKLRNDARWPFDSSPPARHKGLFVNAGHGSKGLITCPISGELLAALICQEPLPLDREVCDAVDPSRFLVKNLIRQTI